jgi:hypothetical protein
VAAMLGCQLEASQRMNKQGESTSDTAKPFHEKAV